MKNLFLLFLLLLFSESLFAQNSACVLTGNSVTIRGFRLGMTEAEAKKRYPKIEISDDINVVGLSYSTISKPSSHFDEVFTEEESEGLNSVELSFFDKKLSEIKVSYDGFTEWDSLEEFTDASAKVLKLPLSPNWQKMNQLTLRLNCNDFHVISMLAPKRSNYELQISKLFFSLDNFKDNIEARKKSQKEEQKKVFKP